jgi:hypothetical protein
MLVLLLFMPDGIRFVFRGEWILLTDLQIFVNHITITLETTSLIADRMLHFIEIDDLLTPENTHHPDEPIMAA